MGSKPGDSTSILKALPGKLDIKSRVSSVLYIPIYSYIRKTVLYIPIFGRQSYIFLYLEDSPIYSYISGKARNVEFLFKTNGVNFKHGKMKGKCTSQKMACRRSMRGLTIIGETSFP